MFHSIECTNTITLYLYIIYGAHKKDNALQDLNNSLFIWSNQIRLSREAANDQRCCWMENLSNLPWVFGIAEHYKETLTPRQALYIKTASNYQYLEVSETKHSQSTCEETFFVSWYRFMLVKHITWWRQPLVIHQHSVYKDTVARYSPLPSCNRYLFDNWMMTLFCAAINWFIPKKPCLLPQILLSYLI